MRSVSSSRSLVTLFFLSGFTSLTYELVFYKELGYVFGVSTLAVTTVLVAYMGGLAIGGWLVGGIADRARRPVMLYGWLELAIGAYVVAVPWLMKLATQVYVAAGVSADVRNVWHSAIRFLLSVVILLPPTILMGGTLPLLVRALVRSRDVAEEQVSRLYGANTFGAAAGTLAANYLFIRFLGIRGTLVEGALVNALIFMRARALDQQIGDSAEAPEAAVTSSRDARSVSFGLARTAIFVTGALSFVLELVWTHLLATIVGMSVYAFGLMLFTFLLGIAIGSLYVVPRLAASADRRRVLAWLQLIAGFYVLLTIPLWDRFPSVFTAVGHTVTGFYGRELVRAIVCMVMLLPPCIAIGATFPLLIRSSALDMERLGRGVGTLYAANTAGCIVGSIGTGFYLLAHFGSRDLLLAGSAAYVVLGLAFLRDVLGTTPAFAWRASLGASVGVLAAWLAPAWDMRAIVSGQNMYFRPEAKADSVLFMTEDPEGGFTTVTHEPEGIVLRSNGKHQGNNHSDLDSQHGFALIPMLFSPKFGDNLHIGLGTGVSSGAFTRFPIHSLDIAELSPGVVEAADRYYNDLNFNVVHDPRVELHMNDGRNHLLLSHKKYDIISVGVSGLWLAGAGNLYNVEFYEQCRAHMSPGGVLQQWVQLHHIAPEHVMAIMDTLRQVFPYVSLWSRIPEQAMLIASMKPQVVDYAHVVAMNHAPDAGPLRDRLRVPDFFSLLADEMLDPAAVDAALADFRQQSGDIISTDDFPYVEYATPLGTAMPKAQADNARWILKYYRGTFPGVSGVPDDQARRRIEILVADRRRDCDRVRSLLAELTDRTDPEMAAVEQDCPAAAKRQ